MNTIKDFIKSQDRVFSFSPPYAVENIDLEDARLVSDESFIALIKHLGLEKKEK